MFVVKVCFCHQAGDVQLYFKRLDGAVSARNSLTHRMGEVATVALEDDYGHSVDVYMLNVTAILLVDLNKSLQASNEVSELNWENQQKMNRRMQTKEQSTLVPGRLIQNPIGHT